MKKLLCFMSFVLVISSSLMISCASMKAPIINQIESIDGFKYVYRRRKYNSYKGDNIGYYG